MRKSSISSLMLVPALLFLGISSAAAAASPEQGKPQAVISIASYDQLLDSVELAGKLTGRPKLGKGLRGSVAVLSQGRGLAGLNTTRPIAIVLQSEASAIGGYACLPVDDLAALWEMLEPLVEKIEDLGEHVYRVQGKDSRHVFAKMKGDRWLFVSDKRERLANTPEDPTEMLAGLPRQYVIAARLNVGSLTEGEREKLLAAIDRQAREALQQRPGEDNREYAIRKVVTDEVVAVVHVLVRQLDMVTLGWSLDNPAQGASLNVAVAAKPGSEAAKAFAQLPEAKTKYAGFVLPDAALCGHVTATCPCGDLQGLFDAIRAKAFFDIDAKESSADRAQLGKEIAGGILDVVQKTLASGQLDGATSLVANSGGVTFVTGRHVADGRKLDESFRKFVAAFRQQYPAHAEQALQTDVGELNGVKLHVALLDVPRGAKNRDQVVQLVGQRLELALGIGEQSVCLAAGRDALATLKKAIETTTGPKRVLPMEMSISLGQYARFVSETGGPRAKERAVAVLTALESAGGDDHIRLVASPMENGVRLRLEFEAGALRMIEAMHKE